MSSNPTQHNPASSGAIDADAEIDAAASGHVSPDKESGRKPEIEPELLMQRPFLQFAGARLMSGLAFQIVAVALGWQMYALTHSAFALGMIGLAQFVPMFALTLVVGHVVDRYERRRVAGIASAVNTLAVLLLALGSWQHWLTASAVYLLAASSGAARAFVTPTLSAMLAGLVSRAQLPRATALSSSIGTAAQIAGPALGGLLYTVDVAAAYGGATLLLGITSALLATLQTRPVERAKEPLSLASLLSGITFIRDQPIILGAISLDLFAVLLGGATALLPIYARDILHASPWALGMLRSAPAVGALMASLILARQRLPQDFGRLMFGAVVVFGLATVLFGVSRSLWLSLAALFVTGAADSISVVIRQSLVQLRTPDAMRGRVGAVNALFIGTSNQLGEFESGVMAGLLGTVPSVLVGGLGTIAIAVLWIRLFPQLYRARALEG
jgi:MFS family permease